MNENWEEIVWRALRNECSSEELMKLQEWRNEAPENEQMYEDIKGIMEMGSFLKGMDSLHKENALENYLKFLKTGGSMYPIDELKVAGVDVTKSEVVISAIKMFDEVMNQFEALID